MKKPISAIDTETTGNDFFHGCKPWLVTACDGKRNYWWEGTVNPQTREVYWEADELLDLQKYINDNIELVFQNRNFDQRALSTIGIYLPQPLIHDTLIAGHLVCSGDVHGLKECSLKFNNYHNDDEQDAQRDVAAILSQLHHNNPTGIQYAKKGHPHFPAATKTSWKQDLWLTAGSGKRYGSIDGERTLLLHKTYIPYLHQNKLYDIYLDRLRLQPILYRMQTVGIHVYRSMLLRLIKEYKLQQAQLVKLITSSAKSPYTIDPAKAADLQLLLYRVLGLEVINTTDGGQPATDEATLTELENIHDHLDTIRYLKSWRKVTKTLTDMTAYDAHSNVDSRIHSNINITGTKWTRFSSTEPNQQNFNKQLLFLFGPPEGYYHLYMDVVNIELRIWAYDVGAKSLIELFESGQSVHMLIARALYPELIARIGEKAFKETKTYTKCKSGTFARIYGGGTKKVNNTYGVHDACAIIDRVCPEIGAYFKQLDIIRENNIEFFGYPTLFTMDGYKLTVPESQPHKAPSARIQGTAGRMVQHMMVALDRNPVYNNPLYGPHSPVNYSHPKWGRDCAPRCEQVQQVHDSLRIEIPCHDHSDITNKLLVECVEATGRKTIPTCPMDYQVIPYDAEQEPMFKDFTYIPQKHQGYDIEMYIHKHKYLCLATLDKDTMLQAYGSSRDEAYYSIIAEIEGTPF